MALGAVLAGEWGLIYGSVFVMFCGYPLFAFAVGVHLYWRCSPAAANGVSQLVNRP
jgi:hypothetical protein